MQPKYIFNILIKKKNSYWKLLFFRLMSRLSARDARLDSRSVDSIRLSPSPPDTAVVEAVTDGLLFICIGCIIELLATVGFNTSPNASNSIFFNN